MIAIIDTVCPRAYSYEGDAQGLGGTEATVLRIAAGLHATVFQHNRSNDAGDFRPLDRFDGARTLIVMRDPKAAVEFGDRCPDAKLVLWMHDLIEPGRDRARRLVSLAPRLAERRASIVAVSEFHKAQIETVLTGLPPEQRPRVQKIYNPLREGLAHLRKSSFDADLMTYFSAPNKGLAFATFVLGALRKRWPRMQLMVANPNYVSESQERRDGVVHLGALPQAEVLERVSGALCTFCPNFEYPETFGLVLAESNAVGVPVLAHAIGAAPEVLGDPRQIVGVPALASFAFRSTRRLGWRGSLAANATRHLGGFNPFFDRLDEWRRGGRPEVHANPSYAQSTVIQEWQRLLQED